MHTIYPYEKLGGADHGWLKARHHFSFASYHDPKRMEFGTLRVINDDWIAAGKGFDPHPHHDMEIITYVRQGAITHRDSLANEGRTGAGDVQVMSAGTGVVHSEYNREPVDTNLFQIWILPNQKGVPPRWEAREFPKTPVKDALVPLASGRAEDIKAGALMIHQDATIYGGRLRAGQRLTHPLTHQAYMLVSEGEITLDGVRMKKGDGAEVTEQTHITIEAVMEAEILVLDVPANEGVLRGNG
jgi:redox-sensitive bicupin YhaK (pirin superfamily)